VQVPALKSMTVADARSQAAGMGLNLDVDNRYYSADVAAGHILSQSPPPGTVVRREWRVRVSESLGPQKVEVPDAVGLDVRVAVLQLRRVGLDLGATAYLPYSGAPEGSVLAQDPPPHAQGIAQPSVNLLVAAPSQDAPDGFVMPDLTGIPIVGAQAALAKVGIKPAATTYVEVSVAPIGEAGSQPRPPIAPGAVTAQQPPPGSRVEQNVQVKLTVAR
jgi:beta-lactam-binding protein with PASTA domain